MDHRIVVAPELSEPVGYAHGVVAAPGRLVHLGLQEWRYRHVKTVERTIGHKAGTGGSAGAAYLRRTLFAPAFPDLRDVRSRM